MEYELQGKEYGLLIEGDFGSLTFQGSRYLGFVRDAVKMSYQEVNNPLAQPNSNKDMMPM